MEKSILEKHVGKLKGKTAWIAGGKRVGRIVAQILAEQGVNIIASYRSSAQEAEEIVSMAEAKGVSGFAVQADVSSRDSVINAVKQITQRFKNVDILVNMASVFSSILMEKIEQKDWDANINTHILGTFWVTQAIVPFMKNGSHVVNIADRTSLGKAYKGYIPYVVTKGAIASLTKVMAVELAEKGIFVNAIAPGPILRPEDISADEWLDIRNASPLKYPLNDEEAVEQFSILVLYLCIGTMSSGYLYPLDQGQNL